MENKILDYRLTSIGWQNWEVCTRMLVHDLIDISRTNTEIATLLDFYKIAFTENGGYTMALPRFKVIRREIKEPKVIKKKKK